MGDRLTGIVPDVAVAIAAAAVRVRPGLDQHDGVEHFDRWTQLEPEKLDQVGLGQQQEGLSVDLLFDDPLHDGRPVEHHDARNGRHEVGDVSRRPARDFPDRQRRDQVTQKRGVLLPDTRRHLRGRVIVTCNRLSDFRAREN